MNIFGFISFLASLFGSVDVNGWASVERPIQNDAFEHAGDEDDSSIWVLFSKRLGLESFLVRFPEDPVYRVLPSGDFEAEASKEGETFLLRVSEPFLDAFDRRGKELALQPGVLLVEASRSSPTIADFVYQQDGKWVREHFEWTQHHLYFFQTKSDDFHGENHHYFIDSFQL